MTTSKAAALIFSLRGRLLFLISLATLPALLLAFLVADNERSAALTRIERDAHHLTRLASHEHAHQIQGARSLLTWLGEKLSAEGRESPVIKDPDFLRALLAGHPQLGNIGVLSPSGEVIASAYPLSSYQSWHDHPAYVAALASSEVVEGGYVISPIFARPTLNHALAVRDEQGQVLGVLFNGLDLAWLSEMASQVKLDDGFELLITDREGEILARSDPEGGASTERVAGIPDLAKTSDGKMLEVNGARQERYFVAAPLTGADGVFVAVGLPYRQVLAEANSSFYRTLIGLGIVTLFTIGAVFIVTELGILRGVRHLARTALRFGKGDLSARAGMARGHNEFSSLSRVFNKMADSLAARHREAIDAQQRLRALASRMQELREKEAARISRELHDEIGQMLTSLKIDLSRLKMHCPVVDDEQPCAQSLSSSVEEMAEHITAAIDFVRRISAELRPPVLDQLGLVAALEWLAHECENRTKLVVQVEADKIPQDLNETLTVALFRIAQEALTNVVRHADAKIVEIELAIHGDEIWLTITDDGAGIGPAAITSHASLGIIGMRERTMLIGGELTLESGAKGGTVLCVKAALATPKEADDAPIIG